MMITTCSKAALSFGRIFKVWVAPADKPWMWASGHSAATVKRAAHGYEPSREAAMAAFAKGWRGRTTVVNGSLMSPEL
jgi:hypothetical protein